MMIFLACSENRQGFRPDMVGDFITPHRWRQTGKTPVWAADNGAFGEFDEDAYVSMLKACRTVAIPPMFITMPDVVADHKATLSLWGTWHRVLGNAGLNRAFVLQDGATGDGIPWDYFEALFIGGTTEFKLGAFARWAIEKAKWMGKWVHMGRVNSKRRLHYARTIGVDSIDGSGIARFGKLPMMMEELRQGTLLLEV